VLFFYVLLSSFLVESRSQDPYAQMLKEIRAYQNNKINPIVEGQRRKFENFLQREDRTRVVFLQNSFEAILERKRMLPQMSSKSQAMQQWEHLREEEKALKEATDVLIQQYAVIIHDLLVTQLYEQRKVWRAEMNRIVDRYNAQLDSLEAPFQKFNFGGKLHPQEFLLWKLDYPVSISSEEAAAAPGPVIFPNPSGPSHQIELQLEKEEMVKIWLIDQQGNFLKEVYHHALPIGPHIISLSLEDLSQATYYYKIIKASGTEVRRFVRK
ncbi:MAG: T9SS type A sorting domain-containing protein, partial [Bacteroidota bacterium]